MKLKVTIIYYTIILLGTTHGNSMVNNNIKILNIF